MPRASDMVSTQEREATSSTSIAVIIITLRPGHSTSRALLRAYACLWAEKGMCRSCFAALYV